MKIPIRVLSLCAVLTAAPLGALAGEEGPEEGKIDPKVRREQIAAGVSLTTTAGWRPVYGEVRQVQSFKAKGTTVAQIGFRAARTMEYPGDNLSIQLRDPRSKEILATVKFTDYNWGKNTVTRYFKSYTFKIGPVQVERGKTYEVVFSAPRAERGYVWLINCFYRNAYPRGRGYREEDGRKVSGPDLDLVLDVTDPAGNPVARTIPADVALGQKQHFALAYKEVRRQVAEKRERERRERMARHARHKHGRVISAMTAPPPLMKLDEALRAAAERGKVTSRQRDPRDRNLTWIAVKGGFVMRYDARDGSLTGFDQFLGLVGCAGVEVRGLAFCERRVWAATDRGALVYDRRTRAWSQLAVNLQFDLVAQPVESVEVKRGAVVFTLSEKGCYALDLVKNTWTKR
ncbi:MAG: hypothetical protein ACYTGB_19490 [Planctomycetota bacterium]